MINHIKLNLESYVIGIFFIIIVFSGNSFLGWGYDEYGAVVSHLELDDKRFIDEYVLILESIGFSKLFISDYLLPIISIFIVPIRWTYALGLSPIYSIIRFDIFSWSLVKLILITIHAILACAGIKFLVTSIKNTIVRRNFLLLAVSFILFSNPFIYWLGTFTSYSYHIFCFGLLIYIELNKANWNSNYFGVLSISRATLVLFNYQYIPVLFCLGLIDIYKNKKDFFYLNLYKSWFLPAFFVCISVVFISVRLSLIGTDIDPELNFPKANNYLIPYGNDFLSVISSIQFFTSRLWDIGTYFFSTTGFNEYFRLEQFSNINFYLSLISLAFLLMLLIFLSRLLKKDNKIDKIFKISVLIIFIQMTLYLFNILPMSPTRHSLIIFLPVTSILVISVILLSNYFNSSYLEYFSIVLLVVSIFTFILRIDNLEVKIISSTTNQCLVDEGIDKIILESCYFEPILDNKNTSFIYSCGSFDNDHISNDVERVALLYKSDLSSSKKVSLLSRYSSNKWLTDQKTINSVKECTKKISINGNSRHVKVDIFIKPNNY